MSQDGVHLKTLKNVWSLKEYWKSRGFCNIFFSFVKGEKSSTVYIMIKCKDYWKILKYVDRYIFLVTQYINYNGVNL